LPDLQQAGRTRRYRVNKKPKVTVQVYMYTCELVVVYWLAKEKKVQSAVLSVSHIFRSFHCVCRRENFTLCECGLLFSI